MGPACLDGESESEAASALTRRAPLQGQLQVPTAETCLVVSSLSQSPLPTGIYGIYSLTFLSWAKPTKRGPKKRGPVIHAFQVGLV